MGHLDAETEYVIWDLFFIKGCQVIFKVALTIMEWMQEDILKCDNFGDVYLLLNSRPLDLDRRELLIRLNQNITNDTIRTLRKKFK